MACTPPRRQLDHSCVFASCRLRVQPNRHCSAIALALNRASTVSHFQRGMPDTIVAGGNSLRSTIRFRGCGEMHSSAAPTSRETKADVLTASADQLSASRSFASSRDANHQAAIAFARRNMHNQIARSFIQSLRPFGAGFERLQNLEPEGVRVLFQLVPGEHLNWHA
jgi:hypothetical protein